MLFSSRDASDFDIEPQGYAMVQGLVLFDSAMGCSLRSTDRSHEHLCSVQPTPSAVSKAIPMQCRRPSNLVQILSNISKYGQPCPIMVQTWSILLLSMSSHGRNISTHGQRMSKQCQHMSKHSQSMSKVGWVSRHLPFPRLHPMRQKQ